MTTENPNYQVEQIDEIESKNKYLSFEKIMFLDKTLYRQKGRRVAFLFIRQKGTGVWVVISLLRNHFSLI